MSSRPPSARSQRAPKQARIRSVYGPPSAPIILAGMIALSILFLWMHFILAIGIEDTGRDIQDRQSELDKIERSNAALRKEIAEAKSQEAMAERAQARGYVLQTPVYLQISEPLAQPTHDEAGSGADLTGRGTETGRSAPQAEPLINILARSLAPARQQDSQP